MVCWSSPLDGSQWGETTTGDGTSLGLVPRAAILAVRVHYLVLVPWIVLAVPAQLFLGFGIAIVLVIMAVGLYGMLARKQASTTLASVALLVALLAGKVGIDLARVSSPDTAVLLVQFLSVIFFMEASKVVLSFDRELSELGGRTDEGAKAVSARLETWIRAQLTSQARLSVGALGLSLVLLVLGGFTSVSINQIAFSAVLVLLVVGALLFLITQRREPETRQVSLP